MNKKGAIIKVFNRWWWMYVILSFAMLGVVTVIGRRMPLDERYTFVMILSIIELIVLRLYKFSLKTIRPDYNYYNELPCYLCNQMTILCILGSWLRFAPFMSYCLSIGTLGSLLALLLPDRYNRDLEAFSAQAYGFYGYHGLLIVTCMSFFTLGLYIPLLKDCIWAAVMTLLLAILAHLINTALRKSELNPKANYVFTYDPDNVIMAALYRRFPVKLWYMLPILPVFTLYTLIFFILLKQIPL